MYSPFVMRFNPSKKASRIFVLDYFSMGNVMGIEVNNIAYMEILPLTYSSAQIYLKLAEFCL